MKRPTQIKTTPAAIRKHYQDTASVLEGVADDEARRKYLIGYMDAMIDIMLMCLDPDHKDEHLEETIQVYLETGKWKEGNEA